MKNFAIVASLLLAFCAMNHGEANAQKLSNKDKLKYEDALTYASRTNYRLAICDLRGLHSKYPENIDIAYNLGLCYINGSGNPDSAVYFLNLVRKLDKRDRWNESKGDLLLALGKAQQLAGNPDEALQYYDEIERRDNDGVFADAVAREREVCANAKMLTSAPVKLTLQSVGDKVNSVWNDYRPVLTVNEDTMYFTSRRPKKDADQSVRFDDGQFEEAVYRAVRKGNKWDSSDWGDVEQIRDLIVDSKSGRGQETVTSVSGDGKELYLCHDGDIYVSKCDENGKWLPAEKLPAPVNTLFDEQNAFVTTDGQELYISSDAPGGYGGRDIYRSRRLPNGQWGEPLNLGPGVNTESDEDAPVFHELSRVLYFSSNGHNTMGGYDIFYSPQNESGVFEAAKNIGFPINSPDDDFYFAPSVDRDRAFYASIRYTEGETPSYDIYEVEYEQPEQNRMTLLAALVEADNMDCVTITTFDKNGKMVGLGHPQKKTSRFIEIVESGMDYDIVAVSGNDTVRLEVSTKKSDSYFARQNPLELEPIVFPKTGIHHEDTDDLFSVVSLNRQIGVEDGEPSVWKSWITTDENPYTVQIMSLRKRLRPEQLRKLDKDNVAEYRYKDGWFVYSYGAYSSYSEAVKEQEKIRRNTPYKDSFSRRGKQYLRFIKK